MIRGDHGSGLCPTQTWPDLFGWRKIRPQNRPGDLVGFSGSSLVGFRLYRFGYWVYCQEQFWSGSASFGRNLVGSVEIWPRFRRIMARSRWILSGMLNISSETLKVSEIWSGMLNRQSTRWRSGLTVRNPRPTTRVFELDGGGSDLGGLAGLSSSADLLDSPSYDVITSYSWTMLSMSWD